MRSLGPNWMWQQSYWWDYGKTGPEGNCVEAQKEGRHLLTKNGGLGRNQPCQYTLIWDFWPPQLWDDKFLLCKPPSLWHFVVTAPANWNSPHCGINTRFYMLQPFLLGAFINTYYTLYWREQGTLLNFEAQNLNGGWVLQKTQSQWSLLFLTAPCCRWGSYCSNQGLNPCSPTFEVQS